MCIPLPDDLALAAGLDMTEPPDDQPWAALWLPMRSLISAAVALVGGGGESWRHAAHAHVVDAVMAALHDGLAYRLRRMVDGACRAAVIAELRRLADNDADQRALRDRADQLAATP